MHTYKIIATWEKKGVYFSVVPHQWETDGMVMWPENLTHSMREKLRSDAASVPEEDWVPYTCVLKCSGISTFSEALAIEKRFTECVDTDAEETIFLERSQTKGRGKQKKNAFQQLTDRNDFFVCNTKSQENTLYLEQQSQAQQVEYSPILFETVMEEEGDPVMNSGVLNSTSNLEHEFQKFKEEMRSEYAKINLNLDRIFKVLSSRESTHNVAEVMPKEDFLQNVKLPLSSCQEIEQLENEIRTKKDFRTQLVDFLSKVGGRTGVEDGSKIAYKIVDCVFRPEVLCQYSWTGVSRGTSGAKKPFQMFDGILEVFFDVLSLADNRHTRQKNCSIFKDGVLKHAKKRTTRKRVRLTKDANIEPNDSGTHLESIDNDAENQQCSSPAKQNELNKAFFYPEVTCTQMANICDRIV